MRRRAAPLIFIATALCLSAGCESDPAGGAPDVLDAACPKLSCDVDLPERCLTPDGGGEARVIDGEAREDGLCMSFVQSRQYTHPADDVTCPSDTDPLDCDSDGLSDVAEIFYNERGVGGYDIQGSGYATMFYNPNTDGSCENDGDEVAAGTDPTDPNDPYYGKSGTVEDDCPGHGVDPVYTGGDVFSYVAAIDLTSGTCCFNLNDAPGVDNGLHAVLSAVDSALQDGGLELDLAPSAVDQWLNARIEDGSISVIAEHLDFPTAAEDSNELHIGQTGSLGVKLYSGTVDNEMSQAERIAGDGSFAINGAIRDVAGTEIALHAVIARNLAENDQLRISDQSLHISLNLEAFADAAAAEAQGVMDVLLALLGDELEFGLYRTTTLGEIAEQTTENAESGDVGIGSLEQTSFETGFAIGAADVLDAINASLVECFDQPNADTPLFALGTSEDDIVDDAGTSPRASLSCTQQPADFEYASDGLDGLCGDSELQTILNALCGDGAARVDDLIGRHLDVDTDGDDVYDGLSVGIQLKIAGAADTTRRQAPASQQ